MPSNKTPLSETTDNALADFPALQDLFEQADEDLRTFYEALSVRLNDYALIDGALSASPAAAPQIPRFLELLDRDVAAFRRAEPAATVLSLRALQRMGENLLHMAGIPALYGRRIGAVGGGVSCGKTAFINSLLTNASCRLAEDEQPVTVLPCHVIAGSDVEKAVARGVSRWGGIFEMPVETCLNLSYSALPSRNVRGGGCPEHGARRRQQGGFPHLAGGCSVRDAPPRIGYRLSFRHGLRQRRRQAPVHCCRQSGSQKERRPGGHACRPGRQPRRRRPVL